jgi:hypothetical protein
MKIRSKGTKVRFTATATVSRAIGEDLFDGSAHPEHAEMTDNRAGLPMWSDLSYIYSGV